MLIWLLTASLRAFAQQVTVAPVDGNPLPGEHVSVLVAIADATGAPLDRPEAPTVTAERGTIVHSDGKVVPGVWSFSYKAPVDGSRDELSVLYGANVDREALTLGRLDATKLDAPATVEGKAGEGEVVSFRVTGADLPPAELLQVRAAEGELVSVADCDRHGAREPLGVRLPRDDQAVRIGGDGHELAFRGADLQ